MFKNRKILLRLSIMALVGLIGALMIMPVSANGEYNLTADDDTMIITLNATSGDYDGNIKTEADYTGNLTVVTNGFNLNGNIEHKGSGILRVLVNGQSELDGNIKNEGSGDMYVTVEAGSVITGNVENPGGSTSCSVTLTGTGKVMGSVTDCPPTP